MTTRKRTRTTSRAKRADSQQMSFDFPKRKRGKKRKARKAAAHKRRSSSARKPATHKRRSSSTRKPAAHKTTRRKAAKSSSARKRSGQRPIKLLEKWYRSRERSQEKLKKVIESRGGKV